MKTLVYSALILAAFTPLVNADVVDDFHQLQDQLDSSMLDLCEGAATVQSAQSIHQDWETLRNDLTDPAARALVPDFPGHLTPDLASKIGSSRARLQQVAALEMLAHQRSGLVTESQAWRDMVTLPTFASADAGGLLLQLPPDQVRQAEVSQALAKEYIGWQVTRCRQLMDALQHTMASGEANEAYIQAKLAEVQDLAQFPEPLLEAAGISVATASFSNAILSQINAPYDSTEAGTALASWREKIEATLPNLLSPKDVTRLGRLLARFVEVIPKEYRNGVENGQVVIPLEYKEAVQFTQQAQSLVNELAPVWRRDQKAVYDQYNAELAQKLAHLQKQIEQLSDVATIENDGSEISSLLTNQFGLSAHKGGEKGQIIEETALDVRDSLNNSLAAAKAGHWQEAESLRLDAYTAFDSEIEIRVMPRDPSLAVKTERSFLDGQEQPGIKALLDSGASIDELTAGYERALQNLDQCVSLLQVAVSPATISFTAFTILAREGLEAIVILAALLAGLRGAENIRVRRGIVIGAVLGVVVSGITFWLSQTLVHSLIRYGEKLEAVISVLAVIILLMVTNWVFHKMYWVGWNARLRELSKSAKQVRTPLWELFALLGVGFLTVYREGFETTIFMQSLILEGSTSAVLLGVFGGFLFIGTIGMLIVFFGAKLPYRKLLIVTGLLVVSIMVTFLGSGVRLFQTVGWLPVHPLPGINLPNWMGVWLGIYPSWEGLCIPPLALVYVGGAWLYVKIATRNSPAIQKAPSPAPVTKTAPVSRKRDQATVSV